MLQWTRDVHRSERPAQRDVAEYRPPDVRVDDARQAVAFPFPSGHGSSGGTVRGVYGAGGVLGI
jgi:hypothetical protein